jgi:phenylacetate-coenzyme A ligase PaaK-like adenylate-forming protein
LHDPHALAVYRALVLVRIDLAWLTFWQWVQMGVRGLRWASVLGTGGHFAGAGWMELERQRSTWKQQAYRVLSVQRPLQEVVDELNAFDPTILSAYPSVMEQLAEEQLAGRLHLRPVLTEIAGESSSSEASSRMASAFGCEIHNAYGASEFPFFAFSCSHGWLHVSSDWVILEPVNEDLQPTPAGTPSHTVLLTNLANRIQPIIRYDLGDSVLVKPDACPCGSHLPAIRVAGRRDDVLRMITSEGNTVAILPLAIGSVVEETPGVQRFQIIQAGPTSLRVRLTVQHDRNADVVWQTLVSNVRAYLETQGLSNVDVVRTNEPPVQSATSGKFRQVIGTSPSGLAS